MAWWAQSPQGLAEQRQLVRSFTERVVGADGLPEMLATWGQRPLDAGAVQDCLSDPTGSRLVVKRAKDSELLSSMA